MDIYICITITIVYIYIPPIHVFVLYGKYQHQHLVG